MVLVGKKAPDFSAPAVNAQGDIINQLTLSNEMKGRYCLLFFYPLDFTFVCPSELIALNKRIDAFKERQVEVLGVSIDSQFTHNAWRNTPINNGGIGSIDFTLFSDITHQITQMYGIQSEEGVAYRASFLIDRDQIVRCQLVNDLPIGRNIDELLRLVDALQFHEKHGEVCPAGWSQGDTGMQADPKGVANYLSQHSDIL
ncbi:MAG: peroxiredoxin [Endozoicomonadaceae bacterium]|nr:peroxiredoxin [Endozoicomonadaceae bacterium]